MKNLHILFLTTSLFLFFNLTSSAQYTSIPDLEFEQLLITDGIDSEGTLNGQVLTSDLASVTTLDISNSLISDLTGIQDFSSLITFNAWEADELINLDLSGISTLENIDLLFSYTITSLNVTGCVNLKHLNLRFTSIATLDLSTNSLLETIDFSNNDGLTDLDLSGKSFLTDLNGDASIIQNLNLMGCMALTSIGLSETNVNNIDLSGNTAITSLYLYQCGVDTINLTNCRNLTTLTFIRCNNLLDLNLTNCTGITNLTFRDNSNQFGILVTDNLINLEQVSFHNSGINTWDASNNPNLSSVNFSDSAITNLDLRNGNNTNLDLYINYTNLECISVDDVDYATNNWPNVFDDVVYSTDCATLSTTSLQTESIIIYPNPTTDYLQVSGLHTQVPYTIYTIHGKLMSSGQISSATQIALHTLHSGMYFLKIGTDAHFKFLKK